jgi:periplasmic protein CpxP/Spy
MNVNRPSIRISSAAAAIACLVCSMTLAAPGEGPPMGPDFGRGGPPFGPPGEDRPPPYLMGLHLSEDQDDKVFAILHAAAPEMRERFKAARKARESLRELGQSAQYDAAKAASLAQALGSAESQLALLRVRTDRDIFMLLTPDQRTRLAEKPREGEPHGKDGPPPPR